MQIDPSGSRQLLELQLSNVANSSSGSAGAANSSVDFANMMDGLLGTGNRGTSSSEASSASLGLSKRSNDGLLWLQLGSQYSSDSGTPLTASTSSSSPSVSLTSLLDAVSTNGEETVPTDYDSLIAAASAKYGVPESLIKAVIDTESNFNPNVVSSAGAKGLMQLMDGTAAGLGVSNSFDPAQNIDGGTKYLSLQLQRFGGEVKMALAAYNAGPGRVSRLGVSNDTELMNALKLLPTETQAYIAKVEKAKAKYTL
ncbi:lytic transglycosylase domain-containing protein [Paenibacillus tundrae]|uniref:Transglycosylase SLT domain-containing protein n=1 Tax=Paenibacillus tundrae TaxID=528187 RepID=A0ABT9W6B2_9BACL|nr:lytic transglycosylase domain-containing protein [Paenibacillus tundrae]MDQ0168604.1 hypothetical protein [Paenibacillus tundrae]